jgi:hypothetical protein
MAKYSLTGHLEWEIDILSDWSPVMGNQDILRLVTRNGKAKYTMTGHMEWEIDILSDWSPVMGNQDILRLVTWN